MTLRHYLSAILRFGWLVDLDQQLVLILDAELCAVTFRVILLLSVVWQSWLSSALDPGLCAVTLSRDFALYQSNHIIALFAFEYKPTNVLIIKERPEGYIEKPY